MRTSFSRHATLTRLLYMQDHLFPLPFPPARRVQRTSCFPFKQGRGSPFLTTLLHVLYRPNHLLFFFFFFFLPHRLPPQHHRKHCIRCEWRVKEWWRRINRCKYIWQSFLSSNLSSSPPRGQIKDWSSAIPTMRPCFFKNVLLSHSNV